MSKWLLEKPVLENLLKDIVTDSIKKNSKFQYDSGMIPRIVRRSSGNCYKWCSEIAKTYDYPNVPNDVYHRHNNCDCTVEYYPGDGKKQDVWSKRWSEDEDTLRRRKAIGLNEEEKDKIEYRKAIGLQDEKKQTAQRIQKAKMFEEKETKNIENSAESDKIKADESLQNYIGKDIVKTDNQSVREWYYAHVHDIPNQIDKSKSFEEQARQAFVLRNKYKFKARAAMSDVESVKKLEQKRPAKSFEELIQDKMKRKNMTRYEALKDILKTASKTNSSVDKEFGL